MERKTTSGTTFSFFLLFLWSTTLFLKSQIHNYLFFILYKSSINLFETFLETAHTSSGNIWIFPTLLLPTAEWVSRWNFKTHFLTKLQSWRDNLIHNGICLILFWDIFLCAVLLVSFVLQFYFGRKFQSSLSQEASENDKSVDVWELGMCSL